MKQNACFNNFIFLAGIKLHALQIKIYTAVEIFGGSRLPKLIVTNKSNNLSFFWHIPSLWCVGSRVYKYNLFHIQVWLTDLHLYDEVTVSIWKFSSNSLGWHWVTLTHTQDWHKYLKITQIHFIWFSDHLWSLQGHEGRFHWGRRSGFHQIFLKCQCLCSTLLTMVNTEFPEFEIWESSYNFQTDIGPALMNIF